MKYMKIIKNTVLILSLIFLSGCMDVSKIDPRVVELDGKVMLTYGSYDLAGGGSLDKFTVMLADKNLGSAETVFKNNGEFNGYISALIPKAFNESGAGVVFRNGSVFEILNTDFKELKLVYEGTERLEIISAAKVGNTILGFGREEDQPWTFYELKKDGWKRNNIDSPILSIADVAIAELIEYKGHPAIFWREVANMKIESLIRGAIYNGSQWKQLPAIGQDISLSGGFATCSDADRIVLIQDAGGKKDLAGSGMPIYEYNPDDGWRSIADIPFSKESMSLTGFGIDIKQVNGKFVVARADEAGIQLYYSVNFEDGVWKEVGQFEEEERDWRTLFDSEIIFNYILVGISLVLLVLFFIRRKKLRAVLEAEEGGNSALPKDARLARMIKEARLQRIGGFASVIDRGFALFIDGFFVMPIPYYYLNAQSIDFMDSVFSAKELVLFFIWLISLTVYMLVAELIFGFTIGKALARIRVRSATGGRPSLVQILIRNTARMIDFFPIPIGGMRIWYLIAVVAASVTIKRQRVGDILAKTVVRRYTPLKKRKIVLASGSPRRKELLTEFGLNFEVIPADIDESTVAGMTPRDFAKMLAVHKANEVAIRMENGELVIAADTVVALGDKILGKPSDKNEAREMLLALSGKTHEVLTGVSIIDTATKQLVASVERTEVEFMELSELEINNYIESGEGEDKAGSYAIQGNGGFFVNATLGSTSNVIGMPMELFQRMLKDLDAS